MHFQHAFIYCPLNKSSCTKKKYYYSFSKCSRYFLVPPLICLPQVSLKKSTYMRIITSWLRNFFYSQALFKSISLKHHYTRICSTAFVVYIFPSIYTKNIPFGERTPFPLFFFFHPASFIVMFLIFLINALRECEI